MNIHFSYDGTKIYRTDTLLSLFCRVTKKKGICVSHSERLNQIYQL